MREFFLFIKERKQWILFPVIIVLLLVAGLVMLAGSSVVTPFIYTLF